MNKEKKFYLIFTIAFILLVLMSLVIETFAFMTLSEKQSELAEKDYYISKLDEKDKILNNLQLRYESIEEYLPLIDITLPSEKESSKILSDINAIAEESGVKLTFLEPSTTQSKKKEVTNLDLLQTVEGRYGREVPLEIKVAGSYSKFTDFLKKFENYQRLMNIQGVVVEKREHETINDYVEVSLEVTAYMKQ